MGNGASLSTMGRNVAVYAVGVGMATVGALGIAGAIDLPFVLGPISFLGGLLVVVFVHERWNGPF